MNPTPTKHPHIYDTGIFSVSISVPSVLKNERAIAT